MFVGVSVGVLVAVFVGVLVGVAVGVLVEVFVGVLVGVSVGVLVAVLVGVSVGVSVAAAQAGPLMVFMLNVTAACASARPFRVAPACMLMLVPARMFPIMEESVKISAAEPSLHQTLHASPPTTAESTPVVSVVSGLKIQTPEPVRFRVPFRMKATAQ